MFALPHPAGIVSVNLPQRWPCPPTAAPPRSCGTQPALLDLKRTACFLSVVATTEYDPGANVQRWKLSAILYSVTRRPLAKTNAPIVTVNEDGRHGADADDGGGEGRGGAYWESGDGAGLGGGGDSK